MYDEKPSFEYETIHDEYGRITNEYDKNYFRLKSGNKKINFKIVLKNSGKMFWDLF